MIFCRCFCIATYRVVILVPTIQTTMKRFPLIVLLCFPLINKKNNNAFSLTLTTQSRLLYNYRRTADHFFFLFFQTFAYCCHRIEFIKCVRTSYSSQAVGGWCIDEYMSISARVYGHQLECKINLKVCY